MISIIIPTYNEETELPELLGQLEQFISEAIEVIVVDGGSADQTSANARHFSWVKFIQQNEASRAKQMNRGAMAAKGNILYFLHADTRPPLSFVTDITASLALGFKAGCYRFQFKSNKWPLKINSYFTRFKKLWCRGGDQSLFIDKDLFHELGGFDERYCIMEEYPLLEKLYRQNSFRIVPKNIQVSSRKYENNSWLKVQLTNYRAFKMYKRGIDPRKIRAFYKQRLA